MDLCIYHSPCYDGFTAAWVVRKQFPHAHFHPAGYGDEPPDVKGKRVIIVDFSYPREVLEKMNAEAASLLVLDHHKSAEEALRGLDYAVFDMDQSGAAMAWNYFTPMLPMPRLVKYVEDRDLWRHSLRGTRAINAWIMSHSFYFDTWDHMAARLSSSLYLQTIEDQGSALLRQHDKLCREIVDTYRRLMVIGGIAVPVVNAPGQFASDIGHLVSGERGVPFAATYCDTETERRFSLRSQNPDGADVSQIARVYGGGGHRHAADFSRPLGWSGDFPV